MFARAYLFFNIFAVVVVVVGGGVFICMLCSCSYCERIIIIYSRTEYAFHGCGMLVLLMCICFYDERDRANLIFTRHSWKAASRSCKKRMFFYFAILFIAFFADSNKRKCICEIL